MASAAPSANLPLFYKDLVPLNSQEHADFKSRTTDRAIWLANQHAVPLTVEEFPQAQRHYPIVFSAGDNPVPLALMGLNDGVNVFVAEDGQLVEPVYVPAYARRYPFLLAQLAPDAGELSLCFDPTSELIGQFDEGSVLFSDGQPTDTTKAMLGFCEQFEQAGLRTGAFVEELKKHGLLMDGEVGIQQEGVEQPFIYRGFQMVNQEKLREVRGDVLRGWNQSGLLALVFAHLFSLELVREIFAKQIAQGKGPIAAPVA